MTKQKEADDDLFVQKFSADRGLEAERIPETKVSKVPDFKILKDGVMVAFCEMKSPQDVFQERLDNAITQAAPWQIAGYIEGSHPSRQHLCIERAIRKAAAQFPPVNPEHAVPNIMMIVSHDSMADHKDLFGALTRVGETGKELRDEVPEIDAYVWVDIPSYPQRKPERFFRHKSPHKETVRQLLKLEGI